MQDFNQQNIGQQYDLKMTINGIEIQTSNVLSSVLREWIFDRIVTLECVITDIGTFVEISPMHDESPVVIEFSKNKDLEKVKLEFSINAFEIDRLNVDNGMLYSIRFIALQKTNNYFYPIKTRSFKNQTTSSIFKQISNDVGVKHFEEIESKDNQIWIQSNMCDYSFCNHLLKRSYVDLEDRPLYYFNRSNESIFTSIKSLSKKKSKFTAINNDLAFLDNGNDNILKEIKTTFGNDNKILFYATDIKIKNISGILNKRNGYGIDFTYFDFRNFFDYSLAFNFGPLSKYTNQNKNNSKKFVNGITYNTLSKNCHENYLLAKTQNILIDHLFFSSYVQISINPNLELKLGDKINLLVYDNLTRMKTGTPNIDKVNSGEYIVGGISHDIKKDGLYVMVLTLFRGGINKSDIENVMFNLSEANSK